MSLHVARLTSALSLCLACITFCLPELTEGPHKVMVMDKRDATPHEVVSAYQAQYWDYVSRMTYPSRVERRSDRTLINLTIEKWVLANHLLIVEAYREVQDQDALALEVDQWMRNVVELARIEHHQSS